MTQQQENKFLWADDLRVIATIAVIVLHVAAVTLTKYGKVAMVDWWICHVFDSLVRFCVPIFLMLSGALMLPKTYELGSFFQKRISRILFPFLFWSLIYIGFNIYSEWDASEPKSILELGKFALLQLKGGASFHLWYIYQILGIYLVFPILSKWVVNSTEREIWYFVVVWLITLLFSLPYVGVLKPNVELRYFTGYLGYPVLGYLLSVRLPHLKNRLISLVFFFVGLLLTIAGTYFFTLHKGEFYNGFYKYLSPNVLLSAVGVFLFVRHARFALSSKIKLVKYISKYSYGIYLGHVLVLYFLEAVGLQWDFIHPLIGIPLTSVLCLFLSLLLTIGISKLPIVGARIAG